ncbi:sulfur oxidation c-type cytochrome SoxX [Sulfitobacter sp. CW3]|jgi:sulfur-oxidizing protein SoxX|uniref:sulfur oxidation c-type cytochrome SoxX n=1 Tax=unclassified Sulfitobacter TaxID=196795 RepID=UPI001A02671E|nr:sulfur oxidation c-type cytochrome SoxX [Sulfitobacter sp. CW3]MBW4963612.1 sulfur oxidation c-type cytochrome SoxX [Sulfitobacter sp. CW3]NOR31843.1 sulfur oxidation c-type cytochrome SoxX [Sulfitobacter sp.]
MRVSIYALVASVAVTTSAFAAEVAPTAVSYTDGAVEMSLTGVAGNAEEGAKIVGSKKLGNCVACHEVSALPDIAFQGLIGPALDGAGDRWSEAELRGIVANAKIMFEGTMMPSFYKDTGYIRPGNAYTGKAADDTLGPLLSAQQIEDVVAYLATLKD